MQKIRKAYHYLFYSLYKFNMNWSFPIFWSEWKASAKLVALIGAILFSLPIYYTVLVDRYFNPGDEIMTIYVICIALSIAAINYQSFNNKNQWTEIVKKYDKLPQKERIKRAVFVNIFIILVVMNICFAFYLMSQIDWSLYR